MLGLSYQLKVNTQYRSLQLIEFINCASLVFPVQVQQFRVYRKVDFDNICGRFEFSL